MTGPADPRQPPAPAAGAGVRDMMDRVRWEETPVGPRTSWPPLLATMVRTLLDSRSPMWMGWGPELTLFYNDAYRSATLGAKHPWALGRSAREVWQEIWSDIGPRVEAVQRGGCTWDEPLRLTLERDGYREETHHTFSCSPVTEQDGKVVAVLCVVTEETARVVAERRLAALHMLASDLATARHEDEVLGAFTSRLAESPLGLRYALVYLPASGNALRLACAVGTLPGSAVAPEVLEPDGGAWPAASVLGNGVTAVVDDVLGAGSEARGARGARGAPATSAVLVPLPRRARDAPTGLLVVGVPRDRPVGDDVVGFAELLAGRLAAGIDTARASGSDRLRAEPSQQTGRAGTDPGDALPRGSRDRAGRTAHATVLVVDDDPDMRRNVAGILEPHWTVVTAPDATSALAAVRRRRPDVVLAGITTPGLGGIGLVETLRGDPATATVPVLPFAARGGEDPTVEGLGAGADDDLVAPASPVELVARVRSSLELAALRDQEASWRTALVEALDEAVIVMDGSDAVVEVNAAFERVLGFPRAGVPYRPPFPWHPRPEEDPEAAARFDAFRAALLRDGRFRGTLTLRHRDGHPVQADAVVASAAIGGERRFVGAFRDLTAELASAEREAALAQFGIRLAEASDVGDVRQAGLSELRRVFGGARAGVEWSAPDLTTSSAGDAGGDAGATGELEAVRISSSDRHHGAVAGARAAARVAVMPAGGPGEEGATLASAIAAPLDPVGASGVVWLELDPPRALGREERALFAVLCGYFGQALHRAQLLDDSRAVANAMQHAILGPTDVPEGVSVRYRPAVRPLEVGGDWYDALELPGGRVGIVVGDCVGRGLPAATVMGQLRSACRALLLETQAPAAVVAALDAFAERIPGAECTTVFCGIVEGDTLRYCSAGHLPALVSRTDGSLTWVAQPGSVPLAVLPGVTRLESETELAPGASLLVCTDGLVERRHESLDVGLARLAEAVRLGASLDTEELADHVMAALVPAGGQEDDVAMVVYRHTPSTLASFEAVLPADAGELSGLRRQLGTWLHSARLREDAVADVLIATDEAVCNAMEHACGFDPAQTVRVTARLARAGVEVRVEDRGPWRPPRPPGDERGRGLAIMRGLMDDVVVTPTTEGTAVVLRRRRGG